MHPEAFTSDYSGSELERCLNMNFVLSRKQWHQLEHHREVERLRLLMLARVDELQARVRTQRRAEILAWAHRPAA